MLKIGDRSWRELSWEQALRAASPRIASILEKTLGGIDLDFDEGLALLESHDLTALGREALVGTTVRNRVAAPSKVDVPGTVIG